MKSVIKSLIIHAFIVSIALGLCYAFNEPGMHYYEYFQYLGSNSVICFSAMGYILSGVIFYTNSDDVPYKSAFSIFGLFMVCFIVFIFKDFELLYFLWYINPVLVLRQESGLLK